jgi:hypothetical protein
LYQTPSQVAGLNAREHDRIDHLARPENPFAEAATGSSDRGEFRGRPTTFTGLAVVASVMEMAIPDFFCGTPSSCNNELALRTEGQVRWAGNVTMS